MPTWSLADVTSAIRRRERGNVFLHTVMRTVLFAKFPIFSHDLWYVFLQIFAHCAQVNEMNT